MAILDENTDFIDQADVSVKPIVMRYGVIAALAFIGITLLVDTTGLVDYATGEGQYYSSILAAITTIAVLYFAIKDHRDEDLGGYITFGRCVKIAALIGLLAGLIIGAFSIVYHSFVRPDIIPSIMEFQQAQFEEQGMTEEQIEAAVGMTEMFTTPVALFISSIVNSVFWNTLLSLIVGGIMKKNRPMV